MRTNFTLLTLFILLLSFAVNNIMAQDDEIALETILLRDRAPGEEGSRFGSRVALDGNRAIIDDFAWEFNGDEWVETSQGVGGREVAISGDYAAMSRKPFFKDWQNIIIRRWDGVSWYSTQTIGSTQDPPEVDGISSLAMDGEYLIEGRRQSDGSGGGAYIYKRDSQGLYQLQQSFINLNFADYVSFVDIHEDRAILCTRYFIYVYQRNGETWENIAFLGAHGYTNSVALYKDKILVGNSPANTATIYQWEESLSIYRIVQTINGNGGIGENFGEAVALSDDLLVIGAPGYDNNVGAAYIYEFTGTLWVLKSRVINPFPPNDISINGDYGASIAIDNNRVLIGAPTYDREGDYVSPEGVCILYEFLPQPRNVKAEDGVSDSQVKISWENESTLAEGFKIYRDGIEIGSTVLAANAFFDFNAVPGKLYEYHVTAYNTTWGESMSSIADYGWRKADGKIRGTVQTTQGAGIDSVEMTVSRQDSSFSRALHFRDWGLARGRPERGFSDDFLELPFIPLSDSLTVSLWIKMPGSIQHPSIPLQILGWDEIFTSGFLGGLKDGFDLVIVPDGTIALKQKYSSTGFPPSVTVTEIKGVTPVNTGNWEHIALVSDGINVHLYVNGRLENSGPREINPKVDFFMFGSYITTGNAEDIHFSMPGFIDEVQLWKRALTAEEINKNMDKALQGNEAGLVSYWPMDDINRSSKQIIADFAVNGNAHARTFNSTLSLNIFSIIRRGPEQVTGGVSVVRNSLTNARGQFSIGDLYYDREGSDFTVRPDKQDRAFDPVVKDVILENASTVSVIFTDTTVFTLSGKIAFAGTECPVAGVELFLNDRATGVFTDSDGNFQIAAEQAGQFYKITPQYGDSTFAHTFSPADTSIFVDGDVGDLNFNDTQKHTLSGRIRGGCFAGLGEAKVRVTSLDNPECYNTVITTTDINGNYRTALPAQKYIVDIVSIDNPDSLNILSFFEPDTVDITWQGTKPTPNYVYHPQPLVRLEIFTDEYTCDASPVPIFQKNNTYAIRIHVLEAYGSDTCAVENGFVTITDDIGGNPAEPTVLPIVNGQAIYQFTAGEPNILSGGDHPYQKLMTIKVEAHGYSVSKDQWALITGSRPRTETFFSTATPELPFMILRDPPGDESYSFLSKEKSYSVNFYQSIDNTNSDYPNFDGNFQSVPFINFSDDQDGIIESVGGSVSIGGIGGVEVSTDVGAYFIDYSSSYDVAGLSRSVGDRLVLTMKEELKTSDNQFITGEKGDVFIGAALNQTFFFADIIKYEGCEILKDTSLAVDYTGFNSTYIYTEDHISSVLIPQLNELMNQSEPDSAYRYANAISVWQQVLKQNKETKKAAQSERLNPDIPDPQYLLEKNISFSGGTSTTQSTTIQTEDYNSITYSTILEGEGLVGSAWVVAGATYVQGFQWKFKYVDGNTEEITNTEINTVGYTLADDDDGDFFSVDVLHDPKFGTPVFNLVAGTSSCPWEPGTQPRDGAQLGINTFVQNDVPPDEPATFDLILGNLSESGEARPYDLRIEQLSNPDGAIIKVGGVPMGDALSYYIPAGDSSYKATLTVERGPRAYDYDNIQLVLLPPCEYNLYRGATPLADTVTFSVHFASPISKASLSYPRDNWEINLDEPNVLAIVIDEYNRNNEYLESVQLQYRKPNGSWQTAFNVARNELPDQQLRRSWNFQDIPDGEYELRAVSNGGSNGMRYSAVATGRIERNTLLVRGNPEPADRVLNIGEEISVSFASGIDVEKLVAQRDISLIDAADSTAVDFSISVLGNKLVIQPDSSFSYLGERTLIATVYNLSDKDGKRLNQPLSWQFKLSQQTAYWKSLAAEIKMYQGVETVNKAVLYNAGTTVVDYKIDYLPRWLSVSADQLSGSLAPGTERHMIFSSGSITTSGILNDSIAVLLDGKRESRPLTLNVLPAPPDWSLAGAPGGVYAAEVYTQLLLDEKLSHDTFDFAGVFIDGRLSGMGHIRPDDMTGKYVAAFKIYSQTPAAGALDFRLWDASEGKEYRFYSDEFSFQAGTSVGSRLEPLIIQPNEVFQSIALDQGVNWLSFNVTGSDLSVDRVLRDWPAQPGDVIKSQYGFSQYSKETGWTGTLDVLRPELGYRLRTDQPGELVTAGTPANLWVSPAALSSGWNWVGYLPEKALAVKDALYFMQAVPGDVIKSQDQSAIFNNNGEWLGTLRQMQPGQSYALYSQANTELIYPELQKQTASGETAGLTLDPHAFEANMTVTAAITFDGADYGDSSYVVSAFVDGQLRGAGHPRYVPHSDRYITFLMIYGDAQGNGEPVRIQVYNPADNVTRDVEADLVFGADAHYGDLQEPLTLSALQTKSERIPDTYYLKQNYPNPFNPLTTIEYGLPVDENVTVTIYDVLGQKVTVLVDGKQVAGRYKLQFDAGNIGMASGVYFYQIRTSAFVKSYKMLLLK